jgi:hypothetical protein
VLARAPGNGVKGAARLKVMREDYCNQEVNRVLVEAGAASGREPRPPSCPGILRSINRSFALRNSSGRRFHPRLAASDHRSDFSINTSEQTIDGSRFYTSRKVLAGRMRCERRHKNQTAEIERKEIAIIRPSNPSFPTGSGDRSRVSVAAAPARKSSLSGFGILLKVPKSR